jgi:hypothetical protein
MLTLSWQDLSCHHGYDVPEVVTEAGLVDTWDATMRVQADLWEALLADFPYAAQYAVGFAWKLRYSMQLNARAAMQMLELRTGPQGHESYRRVCQRMHRLIATQAGHTQVADMMRFVDHSNSDLERLEAERALEVRRGQRHLHNSTVQSG